MCIVTARTTTDLYRTIMHRIASTQDLYGSYYLCMHCFIRMLYALRVW